MENRRKNTGEGNLFTDDMFDNLNALQPVSEPKASADSSLSADVSDSYDFSDLFERLSKSAFRSRFHLSLKDKNYVNSKSIDVIATHAADFVRKRLAPAVIANDGKQTPMRGHPVFIAQHATGCCCRGCFYKWHHIAPGHALTPDEQRYAVAVIMAWIKREMGEM